MKSLLAILTAILLVVTLAPGVRAEVMIGAMGGVTRTSWGGDTPEKGQYRSTYGFTLGAEVDVAVYRSTWLSVQPSFVQRGSKVAFEVKGSGDRIDSVEVNLDYFSLPILVKVETLGGRFYVSGGFEMAWLMNARYKTPTQDLDPSAEFKKYDFLINLGIGYTIPAGKSIIFLELRYSQSTMNVGEESEAAEDLIEPRVKNEGAMLVVGVLYDF